MGTSEKLAPDTGRGRIQRFESLDSTNSYLKEHLGELADFTVIWAEEQTAGRGRFTRIWDSKPGKDLTFSILLPLSSLKTSLWPNIPQVAAHAIAETVAEFELPVSIKWPNDVLVDSKKICGILCESVTRNKRSCAILGIGINVNSSAGDLVHLPLPATTLMTELKHPVDRDSLLEKVAGEIIRQFSVVIQNGFAPFCEKIRQRLAYRNIQKTVIDGDKSYSGEVVDINSDGTLLFRCEDGEEVSLHAGELSFRK